MIASRLRMFLSEFLCVTFRHDSIMSL
jgi:hypothetical protein